MEPLAAERRVEELLRSPGGCALLLKAAHAGMTPAEIVDPVTALHLVSSAIGELNPFLEGHDATVRALVSEGQAHRDLAEQLVREPGVARWWAPLDRERQVWIEPESHIDLAALDSSFPTPDRPPDRFEIYAQRPYPAVSTSTEIDGWTSQHANLVSGFGDWYMDYRAKRARVRVSPDARVFEIASAADWHALSVRHGLRSVPADTPHPGGYPGQPWGANDGLVPDWQAVATAWDGVHLTLWGFLTATQTRVRSEAGWSELWNWEGEQTVWLRWVFESVEPMSPLEPPRRMQFDQWVFPLPLDFVRHRRHGTR